MSKIKHIIHKVASATSSKRNTVSDEAGDTAGDQNVLGFAGTSGDSHPPNDTNLQTHGRRRNRAMSLTDERVIRSGAREAAEEKEKRKQDAEKKKVYDEVSSFPHIV
jgi:hypothetical protein